MLSAVVVAQIIIKLMQFEQTYYYIRDYRPEPLPSREIAVTEPIEVVKYLSDPEFEAHPTTLACTWIFEQDELQDPLPSVMMLQNFNRHRELIRSECRKWMDYHGDYFGAKEINGKG